MKKTPEGATRKKKTKSLAKRKQEEDLPLVERNPEPAKKKRLSIQDLDGSKKVIVRFTDDTPTIPPKSKGKKPKKREPEGQAEDPSWVAGVRKSSAESSRKEDPEQSSIETVRRNKEQDTRKRTKNKGQVEEARNGRDPTAPPSQSTPTLSTAIFPTLKSPKNAETPEKQGFRDAHFSSEEASHPQKSPSEDRSLAEKGAEKGSTEPAQGAENVPQAASSLLPLGPNPAFGEDSDPGKAEKQGSEEASLTVHEAELVPIEEEKARVKVTMERRKGLPVLENRQIDVQKEEEKLALLPGYACSTCAVGPECPSFAEGYVCAYKEQFQAFPVRTVDGVMKNMVSILENNQVRYRMALLQEQVTNGGVLDPHVTRLGEVIMNQSTSLLELAREQQKITVDMEDRSTPDKEEQQEEKRTSILGRIFGM